MTLTVLSSRVWWTHGIDPAADVTVSGVKGLDSMHESFELPLNQMNSMQPGDVKDTGHCTQRALLSISVT